MGLPNGINQSLHSHRLVGSELAHTVSCVRSKMTTVRALWAGVRAEPAFVSRVWSIPGKTPVINLPSPRFVRVPTQSGPF